MMSHKTYKVIVLLVLGQLFWGVGDVCAGDLVCTKEMSLSDKVVCRTTQAAAFVVGGAVLGISGLAHSVLPDTDVEVLLPSGRVVPAVLTNKASSGRKVNSGDRLVIERCVDAQLKESRYYCTLSFPKVSPRQHSVDYYEKNGLQASWTLTIDPQGIPEKALLRFKETVSVNDYQGIR